MLWSSVWLQGPKSWPKPGDHPPISSATCPPASPSPGPPQHEAKSGFSLATSTEHPPRPCPQGPAAPQPTGTQGLWVWGGLPFCSLAGDTPTHGSKPQTFRAEPLTPTPQPALQRLLHLPFPPRASRLGRGIPGPHWRAVICQSKAGEKRNTPP